MQIRYYPITQLRIYETTQLGNDAIMQIRNYATT